MKEIKKQKKRRKIRKRLRRILLILLLLFLGLLLFRCAGNKGEKKSEIKLKPEVITEYEKQVNQITEIDYTKQQEALNAIVESGKMNVNYLSEAVFVGKISEKFNIKNIKNNHYPIVFELCDEQNDCIYVSKKIEPGYEMSSIELTKALAKGTHECKLKVGYAEEGNVSSVFPITIEVR